MEEYGTIRIKLDELIKKAGISKNKLSHSRGSFVSSRESFNPSRKYIYED